AVAVAQMAQSNPESVEPKENTPNPRRIPACGACGNHDADLCFERSPLRRLPLVVPFGVNPQGTGVSVVVAVAAAAASSGAVHAKASESGHTPATPERASCEAGRER
ncbi:MAG: hypothetical protein RL591_1426, partial [Planctomycetota bacterium]